MIPLITMIHVAGHSGHLNALVAAGEGSLDRGLDEVMVELVAQLLAQRLACGCR